jgi:CheY-like chemotaxis protein
MPRASPLIALADDNVLIVSLLDDLLREEGYITVCCSSGVEAQGVIQREQPDLVICDLQMERRDAGIRVVQDMRRHPATTTTPVILYSADSTSLRQQAADLDDSYCTVFAKPFALDTLLATNADLLGSASQAEANA